MRFCSHACHLPRPSHPPWLYHPDGNWRGAQIITLLIRQSSSVSCHFLNTLGGGGWRRSPQQMLRTHRSLKAYCATLWWRWSGIFIFPSNGAPVEWNWQGKTEVLGEKPVPVPLCPPQIPHGLTRDRTRASAVRGRRLTAWAMARPFLNTVLSAPLSNTHSFCFEHPQLLLRDEVSRT
jgi:hypothetical protein